MVIPVVWFQPEPKGLVSFSSMNEDIPLQSPDNRPVNNLERLTPAPELRGDTH